VNWAKGGKSHGLVLLDFEKAYDCEPGLCGDWPTHTLNPSEHLYAAARFIIKAHLSRSFNAPNRARLKVHAEATAVEIECQGPLRRILHFTTENAPYPSFDTKSHY